MKKRSDWKMKFGIGVGIFCVLASISSLILPELVNATITKLRNVSVQLGASGTPLTGTVGNSGNVQQAGTVATGAPGTPLCVDTNGNSTTTACEPILAFHNYTLGSPVGVSASTLTSIQAETVTMPSAGGPFRIRTNFFYYKNGGVNYDCYVSDGTNSWAGSEGNVSNNRSSCLGSGLSTATYANGANVTITTFVFDTGATTIETSPTGGGGPSSALQLEIIGSN